MAPDLVALQRLAGFDWLLQEKGHKVEVDVSWSRGTGSDELRKLFGWEGDGQCLLTEKLFFADGELAIYVRDLVPWEEIARPPRGRLSASLFDFSARHLRHAIDHAIVEIEPAVKRTDATTRLTLAVGEPFARLHERHFSVDGQPIAYSVVDVDDKFIRFEVFRRQ
jgi:GntR family transcriptional regulator